MAEGERETSGGARGPCVLALDVGTSSVRALAFDAAGREATPVVSARYAWRTSPGGAMEADADEIAACVATVVDGAMEAARAAGIGIAAVATAAFWHGLVGVDGEGRAATPVYGWGDARARGAAAALRGRVDERAVHARTGCFVHELYPAARLVWLRGAPGTSFVARWLSPADYVAERLFGTARSSASMASGTGLLDFREIRWDAEMLEAVGVSADALPPVGGEPLRGLLPEYAARWPELAAVPWLPALGDGACASLGSGATGRRLALTVGTSAAVRALRSDDATGVPAGLWCYRLDARRTVAGRALSNAGVVFDWLRRTLALPPPEALEAELAALPPGAHGLAVTPNLLAERPPLPDEGAAAMAGMTLDTTPARIVQAWLEAVAERIRGAVDAVEAAYGPAEEVVAGGGALHASPAFARAVARALGRPLLLTTAAETTARGAALHALEALGMITDAEAAERPAGKLVEPDG